MNDDEAIIEAIAARAMEIEKALEAAGIRLRSPITMLALLAHMQGSMLESTVRYADLVMKSEEVDELVGQGKKKEEVH